MPSPKFPPFHIFKFVIGDAVAIAVVSFSLNVTMAKLFAKKHNYEIQANQVIPQYFKVP